jgi:hypothetical protein
VNALEFHVEHLRLEQRPGDAVVLDVDVIADLAITVDGVPLFQEPEFAVVELAAALARWLPGETSPEPAAFHYTSIEAEESPLIAFEPGHHGWFIRSPWQVADQPRPVSTVELATAARDFVSRVASAVETELGVDIRPWLTAEPSVANSEIHRSVLDTTQGG